MIVTVSCVSNVVPIEALCWLCFANSGWSEDNHVVRSFGKAHSSQFAYLAAIDGGLEVEIELLSLNAL